MRWFPGSASRPGQGPLAMAGTSKRGGGSNSKYAGTPEYAPFISSDHGLETARYPTMHLTSASVGIYALGKFADPRGVTEWVCLWG